MSGRRLPVAPPAARRDLWRSPEQRAASPASLDFRDGEFPAGADEAPEGMTRRTLLGLLGGTLSLAGLAACRRPEEMILPYVTPPEELIPGIPERYATTMPFGDHAYGLVVESHEGRPTKIEGHPGHPATRGASSARTQASVYDLYDPDRSRSVLSGGETSTWEAFATALSARREEHMADGGAGLAVLMGPYASPTLARLAASFRETFPAARWTVWEPCSDEAARKGLEQVAGRPLRALAHPSRARVVLALDADFLVGQPDSVRLASEFAGTRKLREPGDPMARLWVAEARMTPTGAAADHRLRLRSSRMGALLAALAAELGAPGAPPQDGGGTGLDMAWVREVARDLSGAAGAGLILAGAHLPPEVHAAVHALNHHLGHVGATITLHEPRDSEGSSDSGLAALAGDLAAGRVRTLVILGSNPAYAAPADLDMEAAIGKAETVVHLGSHHDETGRLAGWHVPEAHFLESWGDARSADGTLSVIQPLIAPLHGGRTAAEILSLLADGRAARPHELVRETWRGLLGEDGFAARWQTLLHDGLLAGSALPAVDPGAAPQVPAGLGRDEPGSGLEALFHPGPAAWDGRYANNAWLQELPDPVTKLTWDNAACLSPATARQLGVDSGDTVRVAVGEREQVLPALVVPGQADGMVALALGYGRRAAGRIGDGVGADVYALRTSAAPWLAAGARVTPAGGRHLLATTQDHWDIDAIGASGRDARMDALLRSATLEKYRSHPGFAREEHHTPALESIYPDHSYEDGPQWGMTIDLTACVGCNACVVACQSENNIPVVGKDQVSRGREMHWIRIDRYYHGPVDDPQGLAFQPVTCQHCENAPCEEVCPVGATVHDAEGLNAMVYNRCIGTRYCSNNCPYKVRRFNYYNFTKDTPELLKMAANPDVTVRSRGVMEKCTFCTQRIQAAKIEARAAGRPLAADEPKSACQQACPTGAIVFGDIRNPEAEVTRLRGSSRGYEMLSELNNRPRTTYLARIRNPAPGTGEG